MENKITKSSLVKGVLLFILFMNVQLSFGQAEHQEKYLQGKNLLKQGDYEQAMQSFLPLLVESEEHQFEQYSHYFYALSAFKSGRIEEGRVTLKQLKQKYPDWKQMEEANYLLGNILLEQSKFDEALAELNGLGKNLRQEAMKMKLHYLDTLEKDSLKYFQEKYPKDKAVAIVLADKLFRLDISQQERMLLDYLIEEFDLDAAAYAEPEIESEIKSTYKVAVLFPFMVEHLDAENHKRGNQFLLDMYQGIKMAVDSLNSQGGPEIQLFAYDTDKDTTAFRRLLAKPEMSDMDLIIGPVYSAHNEILSDFVKRHEIVNLNPFSNNVELLRRNRLVYLYEPLVYHLSENAAAFAAKNFKPEVFEYEEKDRNGRVKGKKEAFRNKVVIIYGEKEKDSLLASDFRKLVQDSAFVAKYNIDSTYEVASFVRVTRSNIDTLKQILDSTSLTRTSLVFAPVSDQVVAANIVSNIEITGVKTPILGNSDWINFDLIRVEQFMRRNIHVLYPEYVRYGHPSIEKFKRNYFRRTNVYPTTFAMQGFDMMYLFGSMLREHGTYFAEPLREKGPYTNLLFPGYVYTGLQSNAFVPVVKFDNFALQMLNKPELP